MAGDAFEAAATRASEQATRALGDLVGASLESTTRVLAPGDADARALVASAAFATRFGVQEFAGCEFVAVFGEDAVRTVQKLLLPGGDDSPDALRVIAIEMGNICASHYLSAIGDLLGGPLLPTPPDLDAAPDPADGLVVHTTFRAGPHVAFSGVFVFRPAAVLREALARAAR